MVGIGSLKSVIGTGGREVPWDIGANLVQEPCLEKGVRDPERTGSADVDLEYLLPKVHRVVDHRLGRPAVCGS